jgi:hypothetical protein
LYFISIVDQRLTKRNGFDAGARSNGALDAPAHPCGEAKELARMAGVG